ncbi:hypothetical protein BOTBODRAFT_31930 [Botryobasidium botryosum FD-172 SS1]|uniref:RhoGAP-domain-containing protein n=1 Tax=Botryobasidium botryosum (strain FD-172 SS1) TaxID=930990 RepID=A0A067MHM9_BOTB1|nr:hypothetical protein BOTBODRAFT_31930 [Botryobasidium botryosum FD-172 SS1]
MVDTLSSLPPSLSMNPDSPFAESLSVSHLELDSICGGCKNPIESESGGVVVSFGSALWHVECFQCAKCSNRVTADTNLLLLSDGSPVCTNCSYHCSVCKQTILDEAIMTGDESYHAACFTCRTCTRRIEELVFAKTSHGIYCMDCHNERVARSRRHAEAKRNRNKNGRRERRDRPRDAGTPQSTDASTLPLPPSPSSPVDPSAETNWASTITAPATKRYSMIQMPTSGIDASVRKPLADSHPSTPPPSSAFPEETPASTASTAPHSPRHANSLPISNEPVNRRPTPERMDTLPLPSPTESSTEGKRRKSYDDGVRPLSAFFGPQPQTRNAPGSSPSPAGLSVPGKTSRADKRRSINPGFIFNNLMATPSTGVESAPPSSFPPDMTVSDSSSVRSIYFSAAPSAAPSPGVNVRDSSRSQSPASRGSPASHTQSPSVPLLTMDDSVMVEHDVSDTQSDRHFPPRLHSLPRKSEELPSEPKSANDSVHSASTISRSPTPNSASAQSTPTHQASFSTELDVPTERSISTIKRKPPPQITDSSKQASVETLSLSEVVSDADDGDVTANVQTALSAPSLPLMRFSFNPVEFDELLKNVSDTTPRAPRRESGPDYVNGNTPSGSVPTVASIIVHDAGDDESASGRSSPSFVEIDDTTKLGPTDIRGYLGESFTTLANSSSTSLHRSHPNKLDASELVSRRLREAITDATERSQTSIKLDRDFVETIIRAIDGTREKYSSLKGDMDNVKRTSQQYMTGFSVAQEEYHREVAARRDAEAEVTRLRVQLSGQAARLTAMSAEDRRRDMMEQMSQDLGASLSGLERDVSKLKAERDMMLAEVDELSRSKAEKDADTTPNTLARSLTARYDTIKSQYQKQLMPLTQQREGLIREINELKEARDIFLEETTALNARNEELAELNSQISRQIEIAFNEAAANAPDVSDSGSVKQASKQGLPALFGGSGKKQSMSSQSLSLTSIATASSFDEKPDEIGRVVKAAKQDVGEHAPAVKKFKWFGKHSSSDKSKDRRKHAFQQQNILRISRCDHCGDKMWGAQLRCTNCGTGCHPKCASQLNSRCQQTRASEESALEITPLPPSMFGRQLIEQVKADAKGGDRAIPVIVEKCISAMESLAMDYEGIYRKTGGTSQSKAITQLFEKGNYDAFDLEDPNSFNDISSITSVLKNYFRALPDPLLTYALHDSFVAAASLREPREKHAALSRLVLQLPREHYHTLRYLMLHLNRVSQRSEENLMTARNLGVVFGPTLMRSSNSGQEFADMAGKALTIEWLIENSPDVFPEQLPASG